MNKSRAECRAIITKIPLQIEDLSKIPQISDDVKSMLRSHAKVFLGIEVPYCFLSRVESSCAELTLGYNLKHMVPHPSKSQNYLVIFSVNAFLFIRCFWKNYSKMTSNMKYYIT